MPINEQMQAFEQGQQPKNSFFAPIHKVEQWEPLLLPGKFKDGFSAKTLAEEWNSIKGFPQSVKNVIAESKMKALKGIEFLHGFPEYKVHLPGSRNSPSQSDIFVLARNRSKELISMTVEGKKSESFGEYVGEWLGKRPSRGKMVRLRFLAECLEIEPDRIDHIRYQLLHRTASAIIEAEKFRAPIAVMLVHSFSDKREGFEDYQNFVNLFEIKRKEGEVTQISRVAEPDLYLMWVGNKPQ